jgi:acetylornithine deacetylase
MEQTDLVNSVFPVMPTPFAADDSVDFDRLRADSRYASIRPFGAATEASSFAGDAPMVVFGPGVLADDDGPVAHAEREYVRRSDVVRAAEVLTDALSSLV